MGSKGGNTTTSSYKPPAEFMKAYKEALGMARQATSQPYQQYQGQLVAGLTPSQQQGIANVNAAQGMALPAIQQGMQYTNQAAQGITPELYQRFYSPYVKDVANTTFANLMESQAQQQSGLKGGAIQAGAFGGDRSGIAQAEMARQQQLANAMSMSNIYNQGYGQAMGLAGQQVSNLGAMGQQLAGLGAGAQASVLQGAQAQMAAGVQQQSTEQARLQAAYDQWMQRQAYPYQNAQFFANIAQGLGAGAGGTSSTTAPAPNMFSQIFGGLGAIGSIYGASDKRVKENIEAVGKLNDGQTIYRYNFKGDPKTQIGLLAQEVEHRKPGAVAEVKGLKMVNYKDATEDAASMGGVVGPASQRQGFAEGGIPYYPYGDARAYVPEGKIGASGDSIARRAPAAPEDQGLAKDWQDIMPLTKEQAGGLRKLAGDVGIDLPEKKSLADIFRKEKVGPTEAEAAWIYRTNPDASLTSFSLATGGVVGRHHYADGGPSMMDQAIDEAAGLGAAPEASSESSYPTPQEVEAYIADAAQKRGIDPDVAVRVWRSEGRSGDPREAWQSKVINKKGEREPSYGPYQLYMKGGLGNEMLKETGLSPADPRNWKPSVDYSLDKAAVGGWSPWHGAKAIGLDDRAGLANAKALAEYSSPDGGVVPVPASAEGVAAAENVPPPESGGLLSRIKFDPRKLIASEDNPSLIEKIMGRRLSPEARAAVMNASFALMAGRSPFFATNLGEAGKVGTQTYYNALKQGADIAFTGQERETQRMNAETLRINAARQLYSQMLPQIRFWQMRNPGQPLPPEYRRVIEAAYPSQAPAGIVAAPGIAPQAETGGPAPIQPVIGETGSAEAPAAPAAPAAPSGEIPAATGEESVTPPGATAVPQAPASTSGSAGNPQLAALYAQLPDNMNPDYWNRMADNAVTFEDQARASETASKLTQQYQENGIPLPSGVVPFPGKMEMQAQQKLNELQTTGAYEATKEQTERAQRAIQGYQTTQNTLKQAADTLATTPTGQFADAKAYAITALYSLGLGADAERLKDAQGTQELNKIFSQILFSGGLKDKIGSQIAATELQMFSRGFGDVSLEPSVNRFIVGTMRGILEMEKQRAQDWIAETDRLGGQTIPRRKIVDWEIKWNEAHPLSTFIEKSIASTPAAGEINWKQWQSDENYRNKVKFKPGYQYVMPANDVKVYTGNPDDKYFLTPEQYQEKYGGEQ